MKKEKTTMQELTKEEMAGTFGGSGGKYRWIINKNGKLALIYA